MTWPLAKAPILFRSVCLCAIHSTVCTTFQISLLISSSSWFCNQTLCISPVRSCSVRCGYFWLYCFCFFTVVLAVLCGNLLIPFFFFFWLNGLVVFYMHAYYLYVLWECCMCFPWKNDVDSYSFVLTSLNKYQRVASVFHCSLQTTWNYHLMF